MLYALVFLIGAIAYRVRGGFIPQDGAGDARQFWNLPTALLVCLIVQATGAAQLPELGVVTMLTYGSAWLGVASSHNGIFDVGNGAWPDRLRKWALMSALGIYRVVITMVPALVLLWWLGAPASGVLACGLLFAALGALQGTAYALGWLLPVPAGGGAWPSARWNLIQGKTSWGELLWGGMQYAGILHILSAAVASIA